MVMEKERCTRHRSSGSPAAWSWRWTAVCVLGNGLIVGLLTSYVSGVPVVTGGVARRFHKPDW